MKKIAKSSKLSVRESREQLALAASRKALKKKARGRSFAKGNTVGAAFHFKPGQSGNPSGRTSEEQRAAALISKALIARLPQKGSKRLLNSAGRTFTQKLADKMVESGLDGDVGAIVAIADRIEGKPAVSIVGDGNESPIAILIASMNDRSDLIGPAEGMERKRLIEGGDDGREEETTAS